MTERQKNLIRACGFEHSSVQSELKNTPNAFIKKCRDAEPGATLVVFNYSYNSQLWEEFFKEVVGVDIHWAGCHLAIDFIVKS